MIKKSVARFFLIVLVIIAWTYWLPLTIAISTDTLSYQAVENRVRSVCDECAAQLDENAALRQSMRDLEVEIVSADPMDLQSLVESYSILSEYVEENTTQIRIAKYANSSTRHYFFTSYIALSILFLLLSRDPLSQPAWRLPRFHLNAVGFSLLFYVFFNWSNWWRNTPWGQEGRVLFSYAHVDINPIGFAMQELQVLGMMLLCGYITAISLDYRSVRRSVEGSDLEKAIELSKNAKREFEKWQIWSILLIIAFLPWTVFFWRVVTFIGESRYFPAAISIHLIWIFLWILVSISGWRTFQEWQQFTVNCSANYTAEEIEKIHSIEPVSRSMFAISALTSTISFVFPFLQSFF